MKYNLYNGTVINYMEIKMKNYFSENLKKLRHTADITQEKLAEFIGVTPQTISKWERAETYPDIETLPVIANYFGVTIDELLGNDKIKTDIAYPTIISVTHVYDDGYVDCKNDAYGELKHIRTIISHQVGDVSLLVFADNDFSKRIII